MLNAAHTKLLGKDAALAAAHVGSNEDSFDLAEKTAEHEKDVVRALTMKYELKLASMKAQGEKEKAAELEIAHAKYLEEVSHLKDDMDCKQNATLDAAHAEMVALKSAEEAELEAQLKQLKLHYEDQLEVDKTAFNIQVHEMAMATEKKDEMVAELKFKFEQVQADLKEQLTKTQYAQKLLAAAQEKIESLQYELDSINQDHRMQGKYFRQVKAFYAKYAPDKLEKGQGDAYINSILHSYKGHEKTLLLKLVAKYAPEYVGHEKRLLDLLEKQLKGDS